MGNNQNAQIVNRVYYTESLDTPLKPWQLAHEAGPPARVSDYPKRISGQICACDNGGIFVLLPADHPAVTEGGKRYMTCQKCGCTSHL